ncbi:MAG TPA: HEPN domain-containing protein [Chloroflexota bacterium]|jgi:HEPN domain-containing protein|nr:HEPN domain-containing protein [Chloroflexota bacterium]
MPPDDVRAHLTRQWLSKAGHDARAAALALDARDELWDIAAFHAQQTAEKALKGFLAWHSRPTRPTHNLVDLVERCAAIDPTFVDIRGPAELLTRFAVDARYPGAAPEPDKATASEALQRAHAVLEFVLARLPAEAHP